jgi:F0F1-type ATP synthase assembly protein I
VISNSIVLYSFDHDLLLLLIIALKIWATLLPFFFQYFGTFMCSILFLLFFSYFESFMSLFLLFLS